MAEAQTSASAVLRLISLEEAWRAPLARAGVVRYLLPLVDAKLGPARWNARQVREEGSKWGGASEERKEGGGGKKATTGLDGEHCAVPLMGKPAFPFLLIYGIQTLNLLAL